MIYITEKHATKVRFGIIGGINTLIDFVLLFVFTNLFGVTKVASNVISTSIAFCFSFLANKKYTFRSTSNKNIVRELALFITVTLFGLWVIQGVIIYLITPPLAEFGLTDDLALLVAKLIATIVTMIWNYILYSRLVFKIDSN